MRRPLIAFALFVLGFGGTLLPREAECAREMKYKDYPIEIGKAQPEKADRMLIFGARGSIKLVPVPPGRPAVVKSRKTMPDGSKSDRMDSTSFSVRREGTVLVIEIKGPQTRPDWIQMSSAGAPEMHFEIEAPSVPTEIHLSGGSVQSLGWKDPLTVSVLDGSVRLSEGEGSAHVSIGKGDVKIEKWKGRVGIESHNAKVLAQSIEGDVKVYNFSGETQISSVRGRTKIKSKTGATTAAKIEGPLDFLNGRGTLTGVQINGAVRGETDEGTVALALGSSDDGPGDKGKKSKDKADALEADVVVDSGDGTVSVKPTANSGALLKLSTEEGSFIAPDSIALPRNSGPKTVTARLPGALRGTIVVRSKRGTIRIR